MLPSAGWRCRLRPGWVTQSGLPPSAQSISISERLNLADLEEMGFAACGVGQGGLSGYPGYRPRPAVRVPQAQTPPATWVPQVQIPALPRLRREGGFPLGATKGEGKAGETFKVYE